MRCDECGHEQNSGRFCGHCGAVLRPTAPGLGPTSSQVAIPGGTARRMRWVVAAAVVTGAVVVAVLATDTPAGGPDPGGLPTASLEPETSPAPPSPAAPLASEFSTPTDTTLLIDNGLDGATAFELDTGRRVHVSLPGQRAGDQPWRLWQMGGWVIVGWEEIWAVAPGSEQPPHKLGEATVFVPDADPRRVWLIDYAGGRVGQGIPTWTLVEGANGVVLHEAQGAEGLFAIRGVPGGLAVRGSDDALLLYDPETGELSEYLTDEARYVADAGPGHVVWCGETCQTLVVERAAESTRIDSGQPGGFHPNHVWLSAGGAYLAALGPVRPGTDPTLQVFDAVSGEQLHETQELPGHVTGDWGWDDEQFIYLTSDPYSDDRISALVAGRWTPQLAEQVRLEAPADWVATFATFPSAALEELLPDRQADG